MTKHNEQIHAICLAKQTVLWSNTVCESEDIYDVHPQQGAANWVGKTLVLQLVSFLNSFFLYVSMLNYWLFKNDV